MKPPNVVAEFLAQSHDQLDRLERDLVALDRNPGSTELVHQVVGVVHTLGLAAAAHGLRRVPALVDAAETLLLQISHGRVTVSADVVDALLTCADAVRAVLDSLEATGEEGDEDAGTVLSMLDALGVPADSPTVVPLGEVLVQSGLVTPAAVSLARHAQEMGDPRPLGEILLTQGSLTSPQLAAGLDLQLERRSVLDAAVRVDSAVLDALRQFAEQLGAARADLIEALAAESHGPATAAAVARLGRELDGVSDCIRETRLRRLDDCWMCLPRVIRDTAASTGKVVTFASEGGDLRVDRAVLTALRDPLILLVRNAVGHGIESPAARQAAGKRTAGVVRITAAVWGDHLVVEVHDDGAGIDPMRVRGLALTCGFSTAYELARLSDAAVLQLMLLPGINTDVDLTTAPWEKPTPPRGVGLAMAAMAVQAAGGVLELSSEVGVNTTVRLTLPLDGASREPISP